MNQSITTSHHTHSSDVRRTTDIISGRSSFNGFGLPQDLITSLSQAGFLDPSPVQAHVIPSIMAGYDVIARAKNGTGKTGAYLIPLLGKIDRSLNQVQAVVILPTQELVKQVLEVATLLTEHCTLPFTFADVRGGTSRAGDVEKLNGAQIVFGTPGRLLDLLNRGTLKTTHVKMVALDEADELVCREMRNEVDPILSRMPKDRQTIAISVTLPPSFVTWAKMAMKMDNLKVENLIEQNHASLQGITQCVARVDPNKKLTALRHIMRHISSNQVIIFANTIQRVDELADKLIAKGSNVGKIHAKLTTEERDAVYQKFINGDIRVLVASDVIHRGVDVSNVNLVVNFDFPAKFDQYIHRIGRGGRWGQYAVAVSLVTDDDFSKFTEIESMLNITMEDAAEFIRNNTN